MTELPKSSYIDPEKFRLGRSVAMPGEGSWCVCYGRYLFNDDYKCIAGFLTKKEANALLSKCRAEAIRALAPSSQPIIADQMPLL